MSKFLDQTGLARVRDWIKANFAAKTPFTGASSSAAGAAGLVPAPAAGDEGKVLGADGSWVTVSGGAQEFDGVGTTGLVPAPATGQSHAVLFGDGNWYQLRATCYTASDGTIQQSIAKIDASGSSTTVTVPYRVMRQTLWENASPTSNFGQQEITLSPKVTDFHFLMIEYKYSANTDHLFTAVYPSSYSMTLALRIVTSGQNRTGGRGLIITTSGSWSSTSLATFEAASFNGNTNNAYCIPKRILGFNL